MIYSLLTNLHFTITLSPPTSHTHLLTHTLKLIYSHTLTYPLTHTHTLALISLTHTRASFLSYYVKATNYTFKLSSSLKSQYNYTI